MILFRWLTTAALVLCVGVVVFGAYVRLSDAGLGCPDWPGCYGSLVVPSADEDVKAAARAFPQRPLEPGKAWKEMVHRYLASTLGLLIVGLALLSFRQGTPRRLPRLLLVLVIFQGLLGMWTVTWLLKPIAVTAHLLGGMATLGVLWWLWLSNRRRADTPAEGRSGLAERLDPHVTDLRNEREAWSAVHTDDRAAESGSAGLKLAAAVALALLVGQIFLGGWTSSNYAALACPDLPTCQGRFWPELDVAEAFTLWRGLDRNYEYGVLDNRARVTIHHLHRVGAVAVGLFLLGLATALWRRGGVWRRHGQALGALVLLQIGIGLGLVLLQLPLPLAAAHNAGAALLLLAVLTLNHRAWRAA